MLAYNLSPSFNWDAAGLGEKEMKDYVWALGKLGFHFQFITESSFSLLRPERSTLTIPARWIAQ